MRVKILFVHSGNETFIKLDRELLCDSFQVSDFYARRKFPADFGRYWHGIRHANFVFCWFASWNSFWALLIAKIMRKESVLVIGGYDLANLPEADYGHQRGGVSRWLSRGAMHLATTLVTNSFYSQKEAEENAGIPSQRVHMIYHGIPDRFGSLPLAPRERIALTVGRVDFANLKRKGLQAFVQAAAFLPDVRFVLAGTWVDSSIDYLRAIASPNVIFTGWIEESVLMDYYRKAPVYVQASLHEGFGLSVAEAMLAGCIPVVTKAGALPEVVGNCGVYCDIGSPEIVARGIQEALSYPLTIRLQARKRILTEFPLSKRGHSLLQVIQENGM